MPYDDDDAMVAVVVGSRVRSTAWGALGLGVISTAAAALIWTGIVLPAIAYGVLTLGAAVGGAVGAAAGGLAITTVRGQTPGVREALGGTAPTAVLVGALGAVLGALGALGGLGGFCLGELG